MLTEYEAKMLRIENQNSKIKQLTFARNIMNELGASGCLSKKDYCKFLIAIAKELGCDVSMLTVEHLEES